jgi:IS1 family transposase
VGQSPRVNGLVWVVGAAKIVNNKVVALSCSVVVKRDAAAIAQTILPLLKADAVLTTDKWRAYAKALKDAQSAIVHHQVNHSVEFKTKEGHHTNHIEGMWRIVRKELKVRWSRCGTNDPIQQDNRVQFGAWVINHRLGDAETGIVQAMMVLLMNNDRSKPPASAFDVNRVPEQEKASFEEKDLEDEAGSNSDGGSDRAGGADTTEGESDEEPPAAAITMVERGWYRSQRSEKAAAAVKRREANKAKRELDKEKVKKRKEEHAAKRAAKEARLAVWREERARQAAAKAELAQAQEALKEARKRMREEKRNAGRTPTPAQEE